MASKCGSCGSTDTSVGLHSYTCLVCGADTPYTAPTARGRVPNPEGPASYYGDPDPAPAPKSAKPSKKR